MQIKKPTKKYEELPETISPLDYMEWRGVGRAVADATFHAKGFPRLENTGNKLLADKRAVFIYELGLKEEERQTVLKEIAKKII